MSEGGSSAQSFFISTYLRRQETKGLELLIKFLMYFENLFEHRY